LFRYQLLQFIEAPYDKGSSLLARPLKIDERIVQFLLGSSQLDPHITADTARSALYMHIG
jgi:hypothetical protein